jgi:adenylate cyclase
MAPADQGSEGFLEARAGARRRRRRVLLPVAIVALMLAALLGVLYYEYRNMREDALALSKGVVTNLQSRIETEVGAFLGPISGIVRLSRSLLTASVSEGIELQLAEALGIGIITNASQLTAWFVADDKGSFLMVRRASGDDGHALESKLIEVDPQAPDGVVMHLSYHDAGGRLLERKQVPWDGFDPRTRPWFEGAVAARELYWTEVYPFFTAGVGGITAALPAFTAEGALRGVAAADVTLDSLSRFLASLTIGRTGVAMIVDSDGTLIAHPDAELLRADASGKRRLAKVADLRDPAIDRAFDRFRVEGHGRRDFDLDGRRYISSVSSLQALVKRDWSVLVVVPEDDFVGFVVENVGRTLLMGLSVIALAALLAGLLIRQGLRTDRSAVRILEREAQLDAEGDAFARLAEGPGSVFDPGHRDALAPVTEALADAARVRRASLWRFDSSGAVLVCLDCFDRETGGHTQGTRLAGPHHPGLFDALRARETLLLPDVTADPRLSPLFHQYLGPLGCQALLAAPVSAAGGVLGGLWLEDTGPRRAWPAHTVSFARGVANLLAVRTPDRPLHLARPKGAEPSPGARPDAGPRHYDVDTSLGERRAAAFTRRLAARADDAARPGALVIDRLAVLCLRLTDAQLLAEPAAETADDIVVRSLLDALKAAAEAHDIGYLKFFSDQVVAAADPQQDPQQGLEHLAAFALQIKQVCERLFAGHHAPLAFRVGIDIGPAIGGTLDREQRAFAFWGEAVQTAASMADTSLPGAIQVTESVYQRLNEQYLFQLRGHHYLEGLGEFSTYLLSGRL